MQTSLMSPPETTTDAPEVARAGVPLDSGVPVAEKEAVVEALHQIYDPEIPVNIYDLGLIYDIAIEADGTCQVTMSLTAPGCPVAEFLPNEVAQRAASVPGIGEVTVLLTWDPPWTPERMSEAARTALDFF